MAVAPDLLAHDWLGACRRAADGLRDVLDAPPDERRPLRRDGRPRRWGRPDARHRRGGGGRRLRRARAPARAGRGLHASSPRSAGSSTSGRARSAVRRRRPDRRLAQREARPAAPRALDRGGRRPDDGRRRLRLRLRPGPVRGVARRPRRRRLPRRRRARPLARAAGAGRQARGHRRRVRRPAVARGVLGGPVRRHAAGCARSGRSRSACASSPPAASTGWRRSGSAARSTPPRPSSSCARAAASSPSPRWRTTLAAPLDLEPHSPVVAARTAAALDELRALPAP